MSSVGNGDGSLLVVETTADVRRSGAGVLFRTMLRCPPVLVSSCLGGKDGILARAPVASTEIPPSRLRSGKGGKKVSMLAVSS